MSPIGTEISIVMIVVAVILLLQGAGARAAGIVVKIHGLFEVAAELGIGCFIIEV